MSIEELEDKHGNIPLELLNFDEFYYIKHTKLSVEFAISVLEEIFTNGLGVLDVRSSKDDLVEEYKDKIQELKQYLNE